MRSQGAARAALRNYETFGPRAAAEIEKTECLLAQIESALERYEEGNEDG